MLKVTVCVCVWEAGGADSVGSARCVNGVRAAER